ncbi:PREDICTED: olfactory receptor 24-like, partial [Chrysochloris asiatica]|uniref:Olfactory receptor 24-like n=1 Tax=Chrysochloris asiatica TaxID=185453 RepID=A0A9B0X3R4_CHRAS
MRLACVDTGWHAQIHGTVIGVATGCNFVLILGLYGGILKAVLKLPSAASRAKAFSTCSSHMTVVALFYGSAFTVYVGSPGSRAEGKDKLIALVYAFLTPFLNPIIYTLRNKEVKEAVKRVTEVAHYFCDLAPLMRLACVDTSWHAQVHVAVIGLINTCNLVLILGLYGGILRVVLKLPSAASRAKAFSTCSSHMTVVTLFFGSAFIVYIGPSEIQAEGKDKLIALVYAFLTPFLNPIIYTLRNKEVKEAVKRVA